MIRRRGRPRVLLQGAAVVRPRPAEFVLNSGMFLTATGTEYLTRWCGGTMNGSLTAHFVRVDCCLKIYSLFAFFVEMNNQLVVGSPGSDRLS